MSFKEIYIEEKEKEKMCLDAESGASFFAIKDKGKILSVARTTASTSIGAMIIGVATQKQFRGRGLATEVLRALCKEGFSQGKDFYLLFYSNPLAGRIYKKMGFEDVGDFALVSKTQNSKS